MSQLIGALSTAHRNSLDELNRAKEVMRRVRDETGQEPEDTANRRRAIESPGTITLPSSLFYC